MRRTHGAQRGTDRLALLENALEQLHGHHAGVLVVDRPQRRYEAAELPAEKGIGPPADLAKDRPGGADFTGVEEDERAAETAEADLRAFDLRRGQVPVLELDVGMGRVVG